MTHWTQGTPMKLAAWFVGIRNEELSNHNRDKAAEIVWKHKMVTGHPLIIGRSRRLLLSAPKAPTCHGTRDGARQRGGVNKAIGDSGCQCVVNDRIVMPLFGKIDGKS
jgi:hypothetical protein